MDISAAEERAKCATNPNLTAVFIDMLYPRSKNAMLPGKTYTRKGAFVRKRANSTPRKRPAREILDDDKSETEESPAKEEPARPSNAAIAAARSAATKKVDLPPPSGLYDSTSVQDRVRAWQSDGGGVVTASEVVVEFEDSDVEELRQQKSKPTSPIKERWGVREEIRIPKRGNGRKSSPVRDKSDVQTPTRDGTPRKRIISDGHWKQGRNREAADTPSGDSLVTKSKNKTNAYDDGIRVTAVEGQSGQDSKKRSNTKSYLDDGIRVYATPTHSRKNSDTKQDPRAQSPVSAETSETGSTHSQDATTETVDEKEHEKVTVKRKDTRRSARGIFGAVFEESKKMFARTETVYINQPENPRIDNWLGAIPDLPDDPFINEEKSPEETDSFKTESRRRRKSKASPTASPDPNGIWDALSNAGTMPESAEDLWRRQRRNRHGRQTPGIREADASDSGYGQGPPSEYDDSDLVPKPLTPAGSNRKSTLASPESPKPEISKKNTLGVAALQALFSGTKEGKSPRSSPVIPTPRSTSPESEVELPKLKARKPFPSVGAHRLSTIASMDTLQTGAQNSVKSENSAESQFTAKPRLDIGGVSESSDKLTTKPSRRRRKRLTRHADLISVLSVPRASGNSIRSARSVRTHRSRLETATIPSLMRELIDDEVKYMRELRTMVDGVIPVLLASVLSKSESSAIANLFSPLGKASPVSDTIYAMGVALENLKRWHKRLEQSGSSEATTATVFLTWAQGVQRTYKDYLKAWRMGFQDVVVNLASDTSGESQQTIFDKGLPRNDDGDVINLNGERVDVAFLLKRPLVRLKYLTKTLKGINLVQPSTLAEKLASDYQILIEEARHRVNEEKARLEDEAAAAIDATKARTVVDLKPASGFVVNKSRRVRARDAFDLSLSHSGGQRLEGQIELFLREDPPGLGTEADLLICQVDGGGKWLLFPPIASTCISARIGNLPDEIIVMIRGLHADGRDWREILILTGDDEQVNYEWVQMLGLVPAPPRIPQQESQSSDSARKKSFGTRRVAESVVSDSIASSVAQALPRIVPGHQELPTPLGEHSTTSENPPFSLNHRRSRSEGLGRSGQSYLHGTQPRSNPQTAEMSVVDEDGESSAESRDRVRSRSSQHLRSPRSLNEAMNMAGSPNSTLKRQRATRKKPQSISLDKSPASFSRHSSDMKQSTNKDSHLMEEEQVTSPNERKTSPFASPSSIPRSSSAPSTEMPTVSKLRKIPRKPTSSEAVLVNNEPAQVNKLTKQSPKEESEDVPPPPPPHRVSVAVKSAKSNAPEFNPPTIRGKRLSSSPLKHQYEPSSASDDGSDTSSVSSDDRSDSASSSSDDEDGLDMDDLSGPSAQPFPIVQPPASQPSLPSKTLGPSSSASQAPYKTVPSQPNKALYVTATVLYWSEKDQWVALNNESCSIVITPGLVEIYSTTTARSHEAVYYGRDTGPRLPNPASLPLLVLHLTPMVLLQQGTALDVTVRSPPQGGTLKDTLNAVNFLFRCVSAEEAGSLYGLFHHSRMNNPTYIALQQARATAEKPSFDPSLGRGQQRTSSSWFTFGRQKSYRATSVPTPRVKSDPSVGTRKTSFSAKVFGNGRFNIAKSSVMSRKSPDGSIYTTSDNSLESGASTAVSGGADASAQLGLSNTKIRLYSREGTKWLDLGAASLTIVRPNNGGNPLLPGVDIDGPAEVGYAHGVGPHGVMTPTQKKSADDKRIVVVSVKKEATLLDVTLGNSCFERTARTGIAISLWEIFEGGTVADKGGVTNGRYKLFMMQFQNEAACAFTFSIVGRHRY